jgi:glycosyltransferase involved in cell wall biosynthesis
MRRSQPGRRRNGPAQMTRRDVLLNWQLGTGFGWGLLGVSLMGQWAEDPDLRPLMGFPIEPGLLNTVDPLRKLRLGPAIAASNLALQRWGPCDPSICLDAIQIDGMGNDFLAPNLRRSKRMIGRPIFETSAIDTARERLSPYELLLTASTWSARMLEHATGRRVQVIHEGVDVATFCPGPRSGWVDPNRFHVFSGGKIEFRKAPDLVLMAFERFAARHADVTLVTAWQSPWPHLAAGFKGRLAVPVRQVAGGLMDVKGWAGANGIDPDRVVDLGHVPNVLLPSVLREMDVALQPSRAEACTNLAVKEAMACGVPVIAARNTGMLDLLTDANSIPLRDQAPVPAPPGLGTDGWGESDLDEMLEALEFAYRNRSAGAALGAAGRTWLLDHDRTWQGHAAQLKSWLFAQAGLH